MKETSFIQQNKEKWQRFEQLKKDGSANPDELSDLFVEITEDLSYARTFYPRRSVRVYLNNLAQSVFNSLYKLKRDPLGNFIRFWKTGLPIEMYHARKHMFASLLIFSIACLIGVLSIFDDINFARVILGDNYVDSTEFFISEGDPMRVYKLSDELPMSVGIFFNNIWVAFQSFAFGLLFCIGTGVILVSNGIMLGTFQSFFYLKGVSLGSSVFYTSLLTIWIHGTFEILSIVASGGAGFVVGMSLLNPGSYTRAQSFQIGMKRGIKIMLGLTPFLLLAAFLEGYVTRLTDMPDWSRLLIIFGSLGIFVFYFIIYPFIVYRKNEKEFSAPPEPVYRPTRKIDLYKLKSVNEIVADAFMMFRYVYGKISRLVWLIFVPLQIMMAYFIFLDNSPDLVFHDLWPSELLYNLIRGGKGNVFYFLTNSFIFSMVMAQTLIALKKYDVGEFIHTRMKRFLRFLKFSLLLWPFISIALAVFFINSDGALLLSLVVLPLLIYVPVGMAGSRRKGIFNKFSDAFFSFFNQIGNALGLFLITLVVLIGLFILFNSSLFYFLDTIIQWHTLTVVSEYGIMVNFIHTALMIVYLQYFFVFLTLLFGLFYYVVLESTYSVSLFENLKTFGEGSKTHEKFNAEDE